MNLKISVLALLMLALKAQVAAQSEEEERSLRDSLYIEEVENERNPDKVLHAEPLYIDLIRDLGARKGEREWNFGLGLTDETDFDSYEALVEYEWAPIDRLGLEVELPFTLHTPNALLERDSIPGNRIESLKLAAQWSFYVSEKYATSMALGYLHEFLLPAFRDFGAENYFEGHLYNPFFVVAKRWGSNFHSLIYTGPRFYQFSNEANQFRYELHTNFHYMIPGTRNFVGLEINKYFASAGAEVTLRPQMRVSIADNFLVGIVTGIPLSRDQERLSTFLRLIWEPGHRSGHY